MPAQKANQTIWIAEEDYFVEIGGQRGNTISDVTLYHRDGPGSISSITHAETAHFVGAHWRLDDANTTSLSLE